MAHFFVAAKRASDLSSSSLDPTSAKQVPALSNCLMAPIRRAEQAPTLLTLIHPLRAAALALEMEHTLVAQLPQDYTDHVPANASALGLDF